MKKIFVAIVASIVLLLLSSAIAEQEGLYSYQINDDNTVTITGFDWANNHGDIYIPEMLGNRMVSSIGESAFATTGNTAVKITLPDNIKTIGSQAFRGVSITYINIPLSTIEIGGGAFAQCSVMRYNIADGHTVFATIDNALYNKQTKTLIAWPENKEISPIPEGIKAIGDYVFFGRTISDSDYHFLPSSLTTIGRYAFSEGNFHSSLRNVTEIKDYAFYHEKVPIDVKRPTVHISDDELSLAKIGAHAFENCVLRLGRIQMGGAVKFTLNSYEIGDYAFHNCIIDIWEYADVHGSSFSLRNVQSIGDYAFAFDKNARVVGYTVNLSNSDFSQLSHIGEYAFYNRNPSGTLHLFSLQVIPTSSFKIDLLDMRRFLSEVILENKVTEIAQEAFSGQTNLSKITINDGLLHIGSLGFNNCTKLKEVILNNGLLTIGSEAFRGCVSLKEISIPSSVSFIGDNVFADCSENLVITVEAGTYGEVWARTCGYAYVINGKTEDTSWLND